MNNKKRTSSQFSLLSAKTIGDCVSYIFRSRHGSFKGQFLSSPGKEVSPKANSDIDSLKSQLALAVDQEDYRRAAHLRDRIAQLEKPI